LGLAGVTRSFSATGEEALSPAVDQNGFALYLYEEATLSRHVALQFGGRYDHAHFSPAEEFSQRGFDNFSGSVGLLLHPSDQTTVAFSLARAARNPALEELYFHGPHPGNNAFENGDDTLKSEDAVGFDMSFRWQGAKATGEVTYFINNVNNFIYRELTADVEDDLPVTFFTQSDARLQGVEAHIDLHLVAPIWLEAGLDYVHGDFTVLDQPLPRMPPLRGRIGVRYQHNALQVGVDGIFADKQDRIFVLETPDGVVGETPTDGYGLARLFATYSFTTGKVVNTLGVRLENAGNTVYRNHLNYLKDLAPEVGRDFRVTWTVHF
jgi:iron complex outermembrane receptor protein